MMLLFSILIGYSSEWNGTVSLSTSSCSAGTGVEPEGIGADDPLDGVFLITNFSSTTMILSP